MLILSLGPLLDAQYQFWSLNQGVELAVPELTIILIYQYPISIAKLHKLKNYY